jgi:hypothetical protein
VRESSLQNGTSASFFAPLLASISTAPVSITIDLSQRRFPIMVLIWEIGVPKRAHRAAALPDIEAMFSMMYNRDILLTSSRVRPHDHVIDLLA